MPYFLFFRNLKRPTYENLIQNFHDNPNLSSKSVPMVSVKQTNTQLLGPPYHSKCLASGHNLKYFDMYTEKHCYHECSVESIAAECQCRFLLNSETLTAANQERIISFDGWKCSEQRSVGTGAPLFSNVHYGLFWCETYRGTVRSGLVRLKGTQ